MSAAFNGAARLERDDAAMQAVFRGAGQDSLSQSRANGDITYRLQALSPGETQVHVNLLYSLQGPLAQFSRSGLVQDFVRRMIADFGNNVTARLRLPPRGRGTGPGQLQSHGHVLQRAVGAHQAVVRPGRLSGKRRRRRPASTHNGKIMFAVIARNWRNALLAWPLSR